LLGFCWPALRFDWKCKSSDPALPPLQRESIAKKVEDTKLKDCPEENDASKSSSKVPKREIKEGKKSAGASLLDIGVWNPDAINGSTNQSDSMS
jgi:hypothetical protein